MSQPKKETDGGYTETAPSGFAPPKVLWENPNMKRCPYVDKGECGFYDVDQEKIDAHVLRVHGQTDLTGRHLTEDDRRTVLLEQSPNYAVRCPFCLTEQRLRATRTFNEDGSLSKLVRCVECKTKMQMESLTVANDPRNFGRWAGAYKGFWFKIKPDHDGWIKGLKQIYSYEQSKQFWEGYAETNPKFAERRRVEQQAKEYEKGTDDTDESGQ